MRSQYEQIQNWEFNIASGSTQEFLSELASLPDFAEVNMNQEYFGADTIFTLPAFNLDQDPAGQPAEVEVALYTPPSEAAYSEPSFYQVQVQVSLQQDEDARPAQWGPAQPKPLAAADKAIARAVVGAGRGSFDWDLPEFGQESEGKAEAVTSESLGAGELAAAPGGAGAQE